MRIHPPHRCLHRLPRANLHRHRPRTQCRLCLRCASARCERTRTSFALPSWRCSCAGGASWTIASPDVRAGHCHPGKRRLNPTRLEPTVFQSDGSLCRPLLSWAAWILDSSAQSLPHTVTPRKSL
ncbi:hypothetical protein M440DRAFT_1265150 [Trichoderma longibrachiatum ATCC 18648]|uniref:Uncharacterized protein n=1 Tax=Trichoderma longibrachiatum ATCC 18648 TaxID=983965 RepID=A0A2T4C318_TRILO|nr:hypothetical protein M440DRAFT_1265150 [Trichoderma longibrachiatum ATCC 18648]